MGSTNMSLPRPSYSERPRSPSAQGPGIRNITTNIKYINKLEERVAYLESQAEKMNKP